MVWTGLIHNEDTFYALVFLTPTMRTRHPLKIVPFLPEDSQRSAHWVGVNYFDRSQQRCCFVLAEYAR